MQSAIKILLNVKNITVALYTIRDKQGIVSYIKIGPHVKHQKSSFFDKISPICRRPLYVVYVH